MDPLTLGLIIGGGMLLGAGKSQFVDKPKEDRQRELASQTQRFSPWTHLQAGPIQEADPFGSALQFGTTAGSMYAGYAGAQNAQKMTDAMAKYYGQGGMGSMANYTAPSQVPLPSSADGGVSKWGWNFSNSHQF